MADLTGQTPAATYKGLLQVNDYNNGIAGNTGSNALVIQDGAGNATALAISTDNVGIGTTSPFHPLEVQAAGGKYGCHVLDDQGATLGGLFVSEQGSTTDGLELYLKKPAGTTKIRLSAVDANDTYFNAGNVGIGTTSPSAILDVVDDNIAGYIFKASDSGGTRFAVASGGDVGIGTTSPGTALHVERSTGLAALRLQSGDSDQKIQFNGGAGTLFSMGVDVSEQNSFVFVTSSISNALTIKQNGNVGIGTGTFGATAAGVLAIKNGTAPTSSPADMVQLYAKDDAGSSRLYVRNEAGTETVLSPHAADAPSSLYDRPPGVEEMHRSANYYLGTITFTNVDRRNDLLQKQLNGEELPEDRTFTVTETFAEYNARTGADLQVEDWDANQQAMFDEQEEKVVARQAEIDAWDNEEEEAPAPLESYVKKPKPEWLS